MIIFTERYHKKQINKIDELIIKAINLGHQNYKFLLKWKFKHLKAIKH